MVKITITNCRQTHGIERNSHTTVMRHQEDKLSKTASSRSLSSAQDDRKTRMDDKVTKYRTITESYIESNSTTTEPPP